MELQFVYQMQGIENADLFCFLINRIVFFIILLCRETEQLLEYRKKEIDALHKELAMIVSKQKLLEEKEQKMIDVENHRSELEKDLAEMACKNQVIFFNIISIRHKYIGAYK